MRRGLVVLTLLTGGLHGQVTAEPASLNLGTLLQNERAQAAVRLVNRFDAAVRITSLDLGCVCARVVAAPPTIAAGNSADLILAIETGEFDGIVAKSIRVDWATTNAKGTIEIPLRMQVDPTWRVRDPERHLGAHPPGAVVEASLPIEIRAGRKVVPRIGSMSPGVEAEFIGDPMPVLRVRCRVPDDARPGTRTSTVLVTADCAHSPHAVVTLTIEVEGDLRVRPTTLALGRVTRDAGCRVALSIESKSATDFVVRSVSDDPAVLVQGDFAARAVVHRFEIVVPKGLPLGERRGTLVFSTVHPQQPSVNVSYRLLVVDG